MADINYSSGPGGYSLSTAKVPLPDSPALPTAATAAPGHSTGDLIAFAREMARRRQLAQQAQMDSGSGRPQQMPTYGGPMTRDPRMGAALRPFDWGTLQGAATRPVGLGPGMIPGMMADPRLLPPSMRPDAAGASFSPGSIGRAQRQTEDDFLFDRKMAGDRARTANGNFDY